MKSTGMPHPQWRYTDQDIRNSVCKAMEQVKRGRDVFHFIMPDLSRPPCVTLVVALPFVAKQQLDKVGYVFVRLSACLSVCLSVPLSAGLPALQEGILPYTLSSIGESNF